MDNLNLLLLRAARQHAIMYRLLPLLLLL